MLFGNWNAVSINILNILADCSSSCGRPVSGILVVWVAQSCPTVCDPVDCSLPGSSAHGTLQARMLEWGAISISRGPSQPRDWMCVSCIWQVGASLLRRLGCASYLLVRGKADLLNGSLLDHLLVISYFSFWGFPDGSVVKKLPALQETQETQVWSMGREVPLQGGMATPYSVLTWRIPWTEEPHGLQSMGPQRVR